MKSGAIGRNKDGLRVLIGTFQFSLAVDDPARAAMQVYVLDANWNLARASSGSFGIVP